MLSYNITLCSYVYSNKSPEQHQTDVVATINIVHQSSSCNNSLETSQVLSIDLTIRFANDDNRCSYHYYQRHLPAFLLTVLDLVILSNYYLISMLLLSNTLVEHFYCTIDVFLTREDAMWFIECVMTTVHVLHVSQSSRFFR